MGKEMVLWSRSVGGVLATVLANSRPRLAAKLRRHPQRRDAWFEWACNALLKEYVRLLKQQPGYKHCAAGLVPRLGMQASMLHDKKSIVRFVARMTPTAGLTADCPERFLDQFAEALLATCKELEALQRMSLHVGLREKTSPEQKGELQLLPVKFPWTSSVRDEEKETRTKHWVHNASALKLAAECQGDTGTAPRPKKVVTFNLEANQVYFVEKYIEQTEFFDGDVVPKNASSQ